MGVFVAVAPGTGVGARVGVLLGAVVGVLVGNGVLVFAGWMGGAVGTLHAGYALRHARAGRAVRLRAALRCSAGLSRGWGGRRECRADQRDPQQRGERHERTTALRRAATLPPW